MCLVVFAYDHHPDYWLIFGANRDEFRNRPTEPARYWNSAPHVLAGRDRQAGGTWMGVTFIERTFDHGTGTTPTRSYDFQL